MEQVLIRKIIKAHSLFDVLDTDHLDREFKQMVQRIHPDVCPHPQAHQAMVRLIQFRKEFEEGKRYTDDAGTFRTNGKKIWFQGDQEALKTSFRNYWKLMRLNDPASRHFQQYLPHRISWADQQMTVECKHRVVPLSGLKLPQHHVNWILSRLLEFSSWLAQEGFVHVGINPESVCLVPETHGIVIISFYHLSALNQRLRSISGKYRHWYTPSVFTEKKAYSLIDTELAKKTAIYLLGDASGIGTRLKKDHHPAFMDFVIAQDRNPYECYSKYRALLDRHFEKRFYQFD